MDLLSDNLGMVLYLPRRGAVSLSFGVLAAGAHGASALATMPATTPWVAFKARFVAPDGRIQDTGNGGISHSEGQAWGMLLAARHGDAEAFTRIQAWTNKTLGLRPDALLAWRYRPGPGGGVDDLNNATDADLYHAFALLTAERRWPGLGYAAQARRVAADILRLTKRRIGQRNLLLPGAWGFEAARHFEVNLSYYVFPAMDALAAAFPEQGWAAVAADAEALVAEARFGAFGLPPDWLRIDRDSMALSPASPRGDRFGYDAIRVPLNLAWGGRRSHPVLHAAARFWSHPNLGRVPAWICLRTGDVSPYPAAAGVLAIAWLVLAQRADWGASTSMPGPEAAVNYYDAVLAMLAREAWSDVMSRVASDA